MREAVIRWMAGRRGDDVRVIHELALGNRRVDLALVYPDDIVGIEIKGPKDSPGDERVSLQMREYNFYLPEVWLAVHEKWRDHKSVAYHPNVLFISPEGVVSRPTEQPPMRDEMCCSRLLERLWDGEARRQASRHGLIQPQLVDRMPITKVKMILARMLTGHEIMKAVCSELRARSLVGIGSDQRAGFSPPKGVADLFGPG